MNEFTVVPNHNSNLYVAFLINEDSEEVESEGDPLWLDAIVAWNINSSTPYDPKKNYPERIVPEYTWDFNYHLSPITLESYASANEPVIYDSKTDQWFCPEEKYGRGKDSLTKYLKKRSDDWEAKHAHNE